MTVAKSRRAASGSLLARRLAPVPAVFAALLSVAAPAQDYRYGFVTQELDANEADTVQRAGVGWVLLDFNWDAVDRQCTSRADLPGCRDYAALDAKVSAANARSLEILADLSYTAAWANGTGVRQSPPVDLQDYSDYVFDIVSRYAPRVKVWKIWNEPNLAAFLVPADRWMTQVQDLRHARRVRDQARRSHRPHRRPGCELSRARGRLAQSLQPDHVGLWLVGLRRGGRSPLRR